MLDFINNGGGRELYEELLTPYGLQFLGHLPRALKLSSQKSHLMVSLILKVLSLEHPRG